MKKLGLYIHIPFCRSKCPYCDFFSTPRHDEALRERFTAALCREIEYYGRRCNQKTIESIYFGGGTPSLLTGEQFARIMDTIRRHFRMTTRTEISMECNPVTADEEKLRQYKEAGLNRLSIGAQSFDDEVLKILGRIHTKNDIIDCVDTARRAGFRNISLDLMFGINGQSFTAWTETVQKAIDLSPKHISLYSLETMDGTRFAQDLERGIIRETDPEDDRLMYEYALKLLAEAGFAQYEISNVARGGNQCAHNLRYWNMGEYLGFGPGAHSFMEHVRYSNVCDLERYMDSMEHIDLDVDVYLGTTNAYGTTAVADHTKNAYRDNVAEYMFTGLRRNQGISKKNFKKRFGKELWEYYEDAYGEFQDYVSVGAAIEDEDNIRLTLKGMNISNRILALFV